jgi:arylsulfatase A-like enzyme
VVIYLGDNGMQWGTHDCHGIREPYEESARLPLIIRAPGRVPDPGAVRRQMALNIDLAPTLLALAGVTVPPEMDGRSLVPLLADPGAVGRDHFLMEFWRYFPENTPSYTGVRTNRYKYIEFERGRDPWLFDLIRDPGEQHNLYDTPAGDIAGKRLKAILDKLLAERNRQRP